MKIIYKIFLIYISINFLININSANATILPNSSEWVKSYISSEFPESYKPVINELKKKHPNWIFKAVYTNLNWSTILRHQSNSYLSGINTIHQSYSSEWKYNDRNEYADGSYVKASDTAIAYTIDPRNSLTDDKVFQFEYIGYSKEAHTENAINAVLKNTLMGEAKKSQYKVYGGSWVSIGTTYSKLILSIGKSQGISPVHMASRIRQETSCDLANNASINGQHSTYRSKYNFFNIKATPDSNGKNAVTNGLKYASLQNWINPSNSISGGTSTIRKYISNDQNTIYFEKFPTNNEGNATKLLGTGYMTNIMAPMNESKTTYNAYKSAGILDSSFEFHIPVYNNMPDICLNPSLISEYIDDNTRMYLNNSTNNTYTLKNSDGNKLLSITASSDNLTSTTPSYVIYRKRNYTHNILDFIEIYNVQTGITYTGLIEKKYLVEFPKDKIDTTPPKYDITYSYNETDNTVTVNLISEEPLRQTKPTWTLSDDKKTYTKTFTKNMTYSTPITDLSKNIANVSIDINQIDDKAPIITMSYKLNDDNTITAIASSNEMLKNTKLSWVLSEDKMSFSCTFKTNQNYYTTFADKFGNTSTYKIETYLLDMDVKKEYEYNEINNTVTAYIYNKDGFNHTKPTWTLSDDKKIYSKTFNTNMNYETLFVDSQGNIDMISIFFDLVDDVPPTLELNYKLNEDNSAIVTVTSNEILKNTKPTWNLSEDKLSYSKIFYTNQDYSTPFEDKYGNITNFNIKFDIIMLQYNIEYIPNVDGTITVNLITTSKFKHTKPTWTLSRDGKIYSKTFSNFEPYSTPFTDIYGNTKNVEIKFDLSE